jgi:hypothetical protein
LQELLSHFYSTVEKDKVLNKIIANLYASRLVFVNSNSLGHIINWTQLRDIYKENLKVSLPEIYEQEQFLSFILTLKLLGQNQNFFVTEYVLFENILDEDLLDLVYYYCLYSHKEMSEKQFYLYRGSDKKYYDFDFDVDFKKIEDYKL